MGEGLDTPSEVQRAAERFGETLPRALPIEASERTMARRAAWLAAGAFGLFRGGIAASHGGLDLSGRDLVDTWEGLGTACENGGLLFALAAHCWAVVQPLVAHATDAIRARHLEPMLAGERIGALAMTEPEAGSDPMSLRTRAVRDGDAWRLTGAKCFVTNCAEADVFIVFATVDPTAGHLGVTAFAIERDVPGLRVGPHDATMGLADASLASLYLDECRVTDDAVLGAVGKGARVFETAMRWERTMILAPQLGAMRRQFERTLHYARTRTQFGRAVGKNQHVAARIVEMYERHVLASMLVRDSADALVRGTLDAARAALTKLKVSEWAFAQHVDALRVHGGSGYLTDTGIEREVRDALGGLLYSGTSEMQRVIIAAQLGL